MWQPRYTVYFITYYHENRQVYLDSLVPQQNPRSSRNNFYWPYDQLNYDLTKWVKTGQLGWLGSEAEGFTLHQEPVNDFPYANMEGLTGRWCIIYGRLKLVPTTLTGADVYQTEHPAYLQVKEAQTRALQQRKLKPPYPAKTSSS